MTQAAEWQTGKIDDVSEKVGIGPFGSSIRVNTFVPDGIPIISGQHLRRVKIDEAPGFNFITKEHAQRLANANVQRGDVVFTYAGNIGQASYIPEDSQFERYIISQRQFYMRCDRSKVIPEYVALYFKSPEGQHKLLANSSQVGVPMIAQPVTYLRSIEIPIPPLPEQRAIAHVLGTLDDKIELNRRMNRTLEKMARAIFQDWFVDFGPTRAKMEGHHPYLPPKLWNQFPGQLVDSELGEIPEGWEIGALSDSVEILSGGTPRTSVPEYWGGNVLWYTPKDAPDLSDIFVLTTERSITVAGVANSSTQVLPVGTTVISARGTVGRLACLGLPMAMNQTCYGIRGASGYPDYFTYWNVRNTVQDLQARTHGTVFDTITRDTFKIAESVLVPTEAAEAFETIVYPLMGRIIGNLFESLRLTGLRDTLLPPLISGNLLTQIQETE